MPRTAKYDRQTAVERAVTLFWERGYFASSMKHIEQALDMRPGSLYATFGSKSGLFGEALDQYAHSMGENLKQHLAESSSILDGLKRYLMSLATACTAVPSPPAKACMIVKTLLEVNQQEPALQDKVNVMLAAIEADLTQALERAKQQGELRPDTDPARLARLLQAQIFGLKSFAQRRVTDPQMMALAEDMANLLDHYSAT